MMDAGSFGILLWLIAGSTAVFVVILGAILAYHWMRFAMNPFVTTIAIAVFCVVSAMLLIALFAAAAAYSI